VQPIGIQNRLEQLEAAIRHHRQEKASVPDCSCWVSHAQRLDASLYAELGGQGTAAERVARLEEAIWRNRSGNKEVPGCSCWGNAPQVVDASLYELLELS
jgi:hypothetical protein